MWAGMSTVTVTGPANWPRVADITTRGASGPVSGFRERRERFAIRRSTAATPAARRSAMATAARMMRGAGASVL